MFIASSPLPRTTMNQVDGVARAEFTPRQGQYLAFIHAYTLVNGRPPAQADMQRFFRVTPPAVHQLLLTLEKGRADLANPRRSARHRHAGRPQPTARPTARIRANRQIHCAEVLGVHHVALNGAGLQSATIKARTVLPHLAACRT